MNLELYFVTSILWQLLIFSFACCAVGVCLTWHLTLTIQADWQCFWLYPSFSHGGRPWYGGREVHARDHVGNAGSLAWAYTHWVVAWSKLNSQSTGKKVTLQKNHHYIFISCQCQVSFPLMKWSEGPVRRVLPNSHAEATGCAQRLVRVLFIPRAFQVPGVYQKKLLQFSGSCWRIDLCQSTLQLLDDVVYKSTS